MAPVTSILARLVGQLEIVEDDGGGLAAELQGAALEARAADGPDLPADGGRAGEAHLVDARIPDQQFADVRPGGQDAEDPGGQAGLDRGLGQQVGVQRRFRRRLEHDGVPGGQGGRELHRGHEQRARSTGRSRPPRRRGRAGRAASGARCRVAWRTRDSRRRCRRLPAACSPPWRSGRRAGCGAAGPAPRTGHRRTDRCGPRWRRQMPVRMPRRSATGSHGPRAARRTRPAPRRPRDPRRPWSRGARVPTTSSEAGETTSSRSVGGGGLPLAAEEKHVPVLHG